jgi:hypothetical protein
MAEVAMFRAFLNNLVYGFRRSRVKMAAAVLCIFQTHPAVVFQTVVLLRFPTVVSAAMLVLGSLANHLLVNVIFLLRGARMWTLLHEELRSTFREFTFHSVTAESYLEGADYTDMEFWLVKKIRGASATLNDTVRVHVWSKPGAVVANLASYSVPLGDAHVFLSDEPGSLHGIRRFQVLHEIGHALMRTATSTAFIELGLVPSLFLLCWFASMAEWTLHALTSALAFTALVVVWRSEIYRQRQVGRLMAEIAADGFAVGYLSPEDCRAVARSALLPYLKDRDLSEIYNSMRLARLRELLRLGESGDSDRTLALSTADLPQLTLEASVPMILLVGVMGIYAADPTSRTVALTGALTGGLLIVAFFLAHMLVFSHRALLHHLQRNDRSSV